MLVNSPLSEETDREVRTRSEAVDDAVMRDVLKAVAARVKRVDRDHDIPYTAGYSQNGETIYIDRHMPRSHEFGGRRVETDAFLVLHETIEKALLDELGLNYIHAHQIALRSERATVEAHGIAWRDYDRFTQQNVKHIADERLTKVPNDLDLTPYREEQDFARLQQLIAAIRADED
jgi:urease accessory protein UreE